MSDFIDDTRDLLRRTPDVLRALLRGLPESWTSTPDVTGGWRPRDVLGHLISGELEDWIYAGMAGSHDAAVGPWKTYLGILLRRDDPAAIPG